MALLQQVDQQLLESDRCRPAIVEVGAAVDLTYGTPRLEARDPLDQAAPIVTGRELRRRQLGELRVGAP